MSAFDFSARTPMSWRRALRTIPRSLRRRWFMMRIRYRAPRVDIGSAWQARHQRKLRNRANGGTR